MHAIKAHRRKYFFTQAQARGQKVCNTLKCSGQSGEQTVSTPWSSLEEGEVLALTSTSSAAKEKPGEELSWKLSDIELQNMRTVKRLEELQK